MTSYLLISVIIPVYNRKVELKRAIGSILDQTYQAFEILVVDDFSEEDIQSVIKEFNDERIKYFRLPEKGNANVARNLGMKKSIGSYIAFLDSDDEFLPNHLQRRIEKIEEWGCDGIYGSAYINDGKRDRIKLTSELYAGTNITEFFLNNCFSQTDSLFFKSASIKNIFWDKCLERFQDIDFKISAAERCILKADFKPTTRIHWHKGVPPRILDYMEYEKFYKKHRKSISDREFAIHCFGMFQVSKKVNSDTASKYKKECQKYVNYYNLFQYILLYPGISRLKRYFVYFEFSFLNLYHIFNFHIKNFLKKH
jgi:glycosyltransferase involved in cell wall biosynthesis